MKSQGEKEMPSMDELMAELLRSHTEWDEGHTVTPAIEQVPVPEEEATFVGNQQYQVGDEIADKDGNVYIATQESYEITSTDSADAEDGFDTQITVGWHTPTLLKSPVTQVVVEQIQSGQASIQRRDGVTCVQFADEKKPIPLSDLAYSSELGLYQRSKFHG